MAEPLSDKIMEQGFTVAFLPLIFAEKLPHPLLRFVGYIIGILLCFCTLPISVFWIIAGTLVSIWEVANEES